MLKPSIMKAGIYNDERMVYGYMNLEGNKEA